MEALAIRLDVFVEAPIERVWPFISTAEGLSRWFNDAHVEMELIPVGAILSVAIMAGRHM